MVVVALTAEELGEHIWTVPAVAGFPVSSEEDDWSQETLAWDDRIETVGETKLDFAPHSPLTGIPVYDPSLGMGQYLIPEFEEMLPMFTGDSD